MVRAVSIWSRFKACVGGAAPLSAAVDATAEAAAVNSLVESSIPPRVVAQEPVARDFSELFCVVEVAEADFLVGALFRRRFATDSFPSSPKHFVAFHKADDGALLALGYVHFEIWEGQALGGGLVIDERAYRRVPARDRELIRARGGVAEALLRASIDLLPDELIGIWGYVGDKQAEKVDLRVGFRHTGVPHVMVIWRKQPDAAGKARWIARVDAYGPF